MSGPSSVDLGVITRLEGVLAAVGPVDGLDIVDVGCGEGAIVAGYDPFISDAENAWTACGAGRLRLARATADAIPQADGSADIVLFVFSLHHIPQNALASALEKARRLLRPKGMLCVAEPIAEGPAQYVMELYHDETVVRRDAASALVRYATPVFSSERILYFDEKRTVSDFDEFARQAIAGVRYNDYTEDDVLSPHVRHRFSQMASAHGGRFDQPVRVNIFAGAATAQ